MRTTINYKGQEIKQNSEHRFYVNRFNDEYEGVVMFTSEERAKAYIDKHLTNETVKLYLINIYEAYMASEQGMTAVRELPNETPYYKYELIEEADVELPRGFTLETTQDSHKEIFRGNEAADMITEYIDGKHVTRLVTSDGIVRLYTWNN